MTRRAAEGMAELRQRAGSRSAVLALVEYTFYGEALARALHGLGDAVAGTSASRSSICKRLGLFANMLRNNILFGQSTVDCPASAIRLATACPAEIREQSSPQSTCRPSSLRGFPRTVVITCCVIA